MEAVVKSVCRQEIWIFFFAGGNILKVDVFKLEPSPRGLSLYSTVHPEINTSYFCSGRSGGDVSGCRLTVTHCNMFVILHTTDIGETH